MSEQANSYLSPKLEARHISYGFGVFARQPIAKGELLVMWGGVICTSTQFERLSAHTQGISIQVEENLYLVPRVIEEADYVNHSCNPNAGLTGHSGLIALRDIEPDEQICFDYATCDGSPYDEFDCECGATNCRGRVTGNDWQIEELWERYAGHFSPYLQRRIDLYKQARSILPVDITLVKSTATA